MTDGEKAWMQAQIGLFYNQREKNQEFFNEIIGVDKGIERSSGLGSPSETD